MIIFFEHSLYEVLLDKKEMEKLVRCALQEMVRCD